MLAATPAAAARIDADGLTRLPAADVVIVGEVHDNPLHHAHQALAVLAIRPSAMVFEMLSPEIAMQAGDVGDQAALERRLGWNTSGWPDFAMYYPIFAAAAEGAAIFGGDVPRERVRRAVSDGAAAVFGAGAPLFALDRPLDPDERAMREAEQGAVHCGTLPPGLLPGMVEAQRLRDAALAQAVIAAHAEAGDPVVVITGNGHARADWGVPRLLAEAAPDLSVLTIGQFEAPPEGAVPFDFWIVTDPVPRDDPCEAFR